MSYAELIVSMAAERRSWIVTQTRDAHALQGPRPLKPGQQLVGPELYPLYVVVLKVVLAAVVCSAFVAGFVKAIPSTGAGADTWLSAFGYAWNGAFVAIGAVTLVFTLVQHHDRARSKVLSAWAPLLQMRPIWRRRPTWRSHVAAIVAQTVFILWWTGPFQPGRFIPHSAAQSLRLDLAPVWEGLFWPVLGVSVAVILVNGYRLARMG